MNHWLDISVAAFVIRAILFSLAGITLLVAFILVRRRLRRRYFDRLADADFYFRQNWEAVLSGNVSSDEWRGGRSDAEAVITIALDRMDVAEEAEQQRLLHFLRHTGLLDRVLGEARRRRGWRREAALVQLGRTRAPEAVSALRAALDDPNKAVQLAAVRGLSRTGLASAAEAMLEFVAAGRLTHAGTSLLNALISCTRGNPSMLLPYLRQANGPAREMLARVMSEVASMVLGDDLLLLAADPSPEVRASVARALTHAEFGFAFPALAQLVTDEEWFVRLRAVTGIGKFREARGLPLLLAGICDTNRHVRQRAAEALAQFPDPIGVLREVVGTGDSYALQALIGQMDRLGNFEAVLQSLRADASLEARGEASRLLRVVENGAEQLSAIFRIPEATLPDDAPRKDENDHSLGDPQETSIEAVKKGR